MPTVFYNENDVVKKKGKYYLTTNDSTEQQSMDFELFKPYEGKGIIFNLSSSYDGWNSARSTLFNDTINVKKGKYSLVLAGNGTKKVITGDNQCQFNIYGNCKTNIKAGNAENTFYIDEHAPAMKGSLSKNTITAGNLKDKYIIKGGTNKIVDKGGDNEFSITHNGQNAITTGSGNDTFAISLDSGGKAKIKSGDGIDTLNVSVDDAGIWEVNELIADLGNGDDVVDMSLSGSKVNTLHSNIKTGKGEDNVTISAGLVNRIDTGKDTDTVVIKGGRYNYISSGDSKDYITVDTLALGSTSVIKTGKGDDEIEINNGKNTIYSGAGNDTITLKNGTNTVYADEDKINVNDGTNIIYISKDKINVNGGANTIKTKNGSNTINISNGLSTAIYLTKGTNKVNINDTMTNVYVQSGNNTIDVNGESIGYFDNTNKKGTTTINVNDTSRIAGQFGSGVDKIIVNSTEAEGYEVTRLGAGNDIVTLNSGSHKAFYGEKGNDIFYSYGGSNNVFWGGIGNDKFYCYNGSNGFGGNEGNDIFHIEGGTADCAGGEGKDTFNTKDGTNHTLNGEIGNDIFNITGGKNSTFFGGDGKDTFNIKDGSSNTIYGDAGDDIFNIKGGNYITIGDSQGNDIYNLYTGARANISDTQGKNKINIKKGYSGLTMIMDCSDDNKYTFDKNYKLTNTKNVNNDIIVTDKNSLTLYCTYADSDGSMSTFKTLTMNIEEEIKGTDRSFDNSSIFINSNGGTYNIGGKNYKLDLTALKQDLAGWFDNHGAYANKSTDYVLSNGSVADINSLMAVYTKDTAECFIKA